MYFLNFFFFTMEAYILTQYRACLQLVNLFDFKTMQIQQVPYVYGPKKNVVFKSIVIGFELEFADLSSFLMDSVETCSTMA